jgi:hypothetical protein
MIKEDKMFIEFLIYFHLSIPNDLLVIQYKNPYLAQSHLMENVM